MHNEEIMKNELKVLTELISTILYGTSTPQIPKEFNWDKFASLVVRNGFVPLVYERVKDMPEVLQKVLDKFTELNSKELHKSLLQDIYEEQILERFEKEGINCMPLKGIILKRLYPEFYMRSMSDLDILVDVDKLKETRRIMPELGFEVVRYDEHHDIYRFSNCVNVELHKLLIVGEMEDYFQIGFERAHLKEGYSHIYELSIEDFYIHILGHMAYHFAHGGVGIRLALDIRVYLDKYGDQMNREYIKQELEKAGLYTFACHAEKLANIWFGGEESNEFYDELGMYIVNSGYLGSQEHRDILEVVKQQGEKVGNKSRWKAVMFALFLPYRQMAFSYPILKKLPILLPFAWVYRWMHVIISRRENVARMQRLLKTQDTDVEKLSRLYDKLDMKHLL